MDNYDELFAEQPKAISILEKEVPDICATAEPGMTQDEINIFKERLRVEFDKAMNVVE